MTSQDAKGIVSGAIPDCSRDEIMQAWQLLVTTGRISDMPPWYKQMADALVALGRIEGVDGA